MSRHIAEKDQIISKRTRDGSFHGGRDGPGSNDRYRKKGYLSVFQFARSSQADAECHGAFSTLLTPSLRDPGR